METIKQHCLEGEGRLSRNLLDRKYRISVHYFKWRVSTSYSGEGCQPHTKGRVDNYFCHSLNNDLVVTTHLIPFLGPFCLWPKVTLKTFRCTVQLWMSLQQMKINLSTHFPEHHKRMILSFQKSVDQCFEQVQSPGTWSWL